ncbi:sensor domain-containing diguanylate cyclase [Undibacterium sp. TJN19]|uniref:sensor domain-containing diguanylate cyclase n=1 Tax=Undibacterium sp. TJN19 TaxID=3413055 RepID=UPI003BF0DE26
MSLSTSQHLDGNSPYLLSMYRMLLASIAGKSAADDILQRMVASLDEQYPVMSSAIFFAHGENDSPEMRVVSRLSLDCLTALVDSQCVSDMFNQPSTSRNMPAFPDVKLETSIFWQRLQLASQRHALSPCIGLPIMNADQLLLGCLVFFVKKDTQFSAIPANLLDELARLIASLLEHQRDQHKIQSVQDEMRKSQASMMRMSLAIEGSATGIWDRNVETGEIHYSPGWKAILGYADAEISNRIEDSYTRLHPDDLPFVQATMKAHFEGKTDSYTVEHRVRCKDGSYKWICSRGKVVSRAKDGRPLRMIGTTTDVTAMHLLSERLQESAELVTCLTNEVPGLAYQYRMRADGEEHFSYVSEGIRDIYELTPAQMADGVALVHELIHADDFAKYRAAILNSAAKLERLHLEYRVNLPVQGLCWWQMDARPRRLPDGETLWHGFITDISEHKRIELELQALATIDFLTQIPNRRCFMERMAEELARIQRGISRPSAVLMCDLDNFKLINDNYGHAVGDQVLRHFANILQDELRKSDYAGRVGGEEFAVVLTGATVADATVFAERVQKQMRETPVNANAQIIRFTVSIGIATMLASDKDAHASLLRSDTALYRAKEAGRNRIIVAVE